jgi:hypothetical protein
MSKTLVRILVPLVLIGFGGFLFYLSWRDGTAHEVMRTRGSKVTATISDTVVTYNKQATPAYSVTLQWRDAAGGQRSFGPTHISPAFFRSAGLVHGRQSVPADILYLDDDPGARPVIVADEAERTYQDNFAFYAGLVFMAVGCIVGWFWSALMRLTHSAARSA